MNWMGGKGVLEERRGGGGLAQGLGIGGGGLGPKKVCTKNGQAGFSQRSISFFPTKVPLVGGGGRGVPPPQGCSGRGGRYPPPFRAPSLCPATVSLTPSARFNDICNRQ